MVFTWNYFSVVVLFSFFSKIKSDCEPQNCIPGQWTPWTSCSVLAQHTVNWTTTTHTRPCLVSLHCLTWVSTTFLFPFNAQIPKLNPFLFTLSYTRTPPCPGSKNTILSTTQISTFCFRVFCIPGQWTPWTSCSVTCNKTPGTRHRERDIMMVESCGGTCDVDLHP
jgi:hypothetical protein